MISRRPKRGRSVLRSVKGTRFAWQPNSRRIKRTTVSFTRAALGNARIQARLRLSKSMWAVQWTKLRFNCQTDKSSRKLTWRAHIFLWMHSRRWGAFRVATRIWNAPVLHSASIRLQDETAFSPTEETIFNVASSSGFHSYETTHQVQHQFSQRSLIILVWRILI